MARTSCAGKRNGDSENSKCVAIFPIPAKPRETQNWKSSVEFQIRVCTSEYTYLSVVPTFSSGDTRRLRRETETSIPGPAVWHVQVATGCSPCEGNVRAWVIAALRPSDVTIPQQQAPAWKKEFLSPRLRCEPSYRCRRDPGLQSARHAPRDDVVVHGAAQLG